jgi:hypothetical protein
MAVALRIFLLNPPAGTLRADATLAEAQQRRMKECIVLARWFE